MAKVGWAREWTRRRTNRTLVGGWPSAATRGPIRFPEAYCLRVPSAQGQNGSRGLIRVVCVLRDAGRTRDKILAFVRDVWEPACCAPAWSEPEFRDCIDRHCASATPRVPAGRTRGESECPATRGGRSW